jgi:hypothetical protein
MKPVLLHIGLPRTGTTALQHWLQLHSRALAKSGVFTFDQMTLAHRLGVQGLGELERRVDADVIGIAGHELSDAIKQLSAATADPAISSIFISSEYFSIADPLQTKETFQRLGLTDVTIILTVRRQDRFIESGYAQEVVHMRHTDRCPAPRGYDKKYDWNELATRWATAFHQKIAVLVYDRLAGAGRSVNREIIQLIGGAIGEFAAKNVESDRRLNMGASAPAVEFKRLANHIDGLNLHAIAKCILKDTSPRPQFKMSLENATEFMRIYRASNRELARHFLGTDDDPFDDDLDLAARHEQSDFTGRLPRDEFDRMLALCRDQDHPQLDALVELYNRYRAGGSADSSTLLVS